VDYTYNDQSIDHEDSTFDDKTFETQLGGQVIECDYGQPIDYPDTMDFGVQDQLGEQVIEHDYGQPIDYPDTIDVGVQDQLGGQVIEQPIDYPDYNYGDEEQGREQSAGYDSY
jgi:hypothetical protein